MKKIEKHDFPYLIAQRAVRTAWSVESEGSIDESKSETRQRKSTNRKATSEHRQTNIEKDTKTALTNQKLDPRRPKMTPGAPPTGAKRSRRGTKKRSPTASRTKNRTKTSTRPTWICQGGDSPTFLSPPGAHLGSQGTLFTTFHGSGGGHNQLIN